MTVRIGLLGCGRIARYFHLPALRDLPGANLVVVADPDPEAAEHVRAVAPGVTLEPSWADVIDAGDLDAVVICLPTHLHVPAATAALTAGLAVYVEKPVAIDEAGIESLSAALAAATDPIAMAGFNFRFHPLYEQTAPILAGGRLGELLAVRTTFAAAPRALPTWKQARATGGGALLDLASHHIDLVHLLFGPVQTVTATVRSRRDEDDTATMTLTLAEGLEVQTLVTSSGIQQDRIEVLGDAGEMTLDRYRHQRPQIAPPTGDGRGPRLVAATRAAPPDRRHRAGPGRAPGRSLLRPGAQLLRRRRGRRSTDRSEPPGRDAQPGRGARRRAVRPGRWPTGGHRAMTAPAP